MEQQIEQSLRKYKDQGKDMIKASQALQAQGNDDIDLFIEENMARFRQILAHVFDIEPGQVRWNEQILSAVKEHLNNKFNLPEDIQHNDLLESKKHYIDAMTSLRHAFYFADKYELLRVVKTHYRIDNDFINNQDGTYQTRVNFFVYHLRQIDGIDNLMEACQIIKDEFFYLGNDRLIPSIAQEYRVDDGNVPM